MPDTQAAAAEAETLQLIPDVQKGWRRHATGYNGLVTLLIITKLGLAVSNRVVQKIMLVPMLPFAYFVSNFMSLAYVVLYGTLLLGSFHLGYVTDQGLWSQACLGIPKRRLVLVGLCDTVGSVLSTVAASRISGPLVVVLGQSIVPFSMLTSHLLLGSRYSRLQLVSVAIVVAGVVIAALVGNDGTGHYPLFFTVLSVLAMLPYTVSFALKEMVFRENQGLHVLVVNFFSSVFQLLFTIFCLPIVSLPQFGGIPLHVLPQYISLGLQCAMGTEEPLDLVSPVNDMGVPVSEWSKCHYMPYPLLLYVAINISLNILVLVVVKHAGAVLNFVVGTVATSLQYFAFVVDWPLLPRSTLSPSNYIGFACSVCGLVMYRLAGMKKEAEEQSATKG